MSEYQFRRVLNAFAGDVPPTALARKMVLSLNSVASAYKRLRSHYVRIDVFRNFYHDNYPDGSPDPAGDKSLEALEHDLLAFHLNRVSRMRGIKSGAGVVDDHFCESWWRFHFEPFFENRSPDTVREMIYSELLAYLKVGGPVGTLAPNVTAIRACEIEFLDRKALWLKRNASSFRDPALRKQLDQIASL